MIEEENMPINVKSLLRMLRYFCVIPHMISLQELESILMNTIPPLT